MKIKQKKNKQRKTIKIIKKKEIIIKKEKNKYLFF